MLILNKCYIPTNMSNYKSVKKGVHLITVRVFHFPSDWLLNRIFVESSLADQAYAAKKLQEVDIRSKSEHIWDGSRGNKKTYNCVAEHLRVLCISPYRYMSKTDVPTLLLAFKIYHIPPSFYLCQNISSFDLLFTCIRRFTYMF